MISNSYRARNLPITPSPLTFALASVNTTNASSAWFTLYQSNVSYSVLESSVASTIAYVPEELEVELKIPALATGAMPSGATQTLLIETSTAASEATLDEQLMSYVVTGLTTNGSAATAIRVRVPSNSAPYIRGRVLAGGNTGNAAGSNGTFTIFG